MAPPECAPFTQRPFQSAFTDISAPFATDTPNNCSPVSTVIGEHCSSKKHFANYRMVFNFHNPLLHHRGGGFLLTRKSKTPRISSEALAQLSQPRRFRRC
jgi:hypothetical protein